MDKDSIERIFKFGGAVGSLIFWGMLLILFFGVTYVVCPDVAVGTLIFIVAVLGLGWFIEYRRKKKGLL